MKSSVLVHRGGEDDSLHDLIVLGIIGTYSLLSIAISYQLYQRIKSKSYLVYVLLETCLLLFTIISIPENLNYFICLECKSWIAINAMSLVSMMFHYTAVSLIVVTHMRLYGEAKLISDPCNTSYFPERVILIQKISIFIVSLWTAISLVNMLSYSNTVEGLESYQDGTVYIALQWLFTLGLCTSCITLVAFGIFVHRNALSVDTVENNDTLNLMKSFIRFTGILIGIMALLYSLRLFLLLIYHTNRDLISDMVIFLLFKNIPFMLSTTAMVVIMHRGFLTFEENLTNDRMSAKDVSRRKNNLAVSVLDVHQEKRKLSSSDCKGSSYQWNVLASSATTSSPAVNYQNFNSTQYNSSDAQRSNWFGTECVESNAIGSKSTASDIEEGRMRLRSMSDNKSCFVLPSGRVTAISSVDGSEIL